MQGDDCQNILAFHYSKENLFPFEESEENKYDDVPDESKYRGRAKAAYRWIELSSVDRLASWGN